MKNPKNKRPIWAVDCETDPFQHGRVPRPFLWGVYEGYSDRYWEFEHTSDCIAFLAKQDVIAYAHNGGKFDWHFLTPYLDPTKPLLIINGRLSKLEIGQCELRDSFNLLPIGLGQYNKTSIEYWKMEEKVRRQHWEEIRAYLRSDCVNLWNMVHGFVEEYGLHLTQASAAMQIWARMSGRRPPRTSAAYYDTFKPYYFGGRVQCFESGDLAVEAKGADINSAYPAAMMDKHPIGSEYVQILGEPQQPIEKLRHGFFKVRARSYGALPYRGTNGALYFPADDVIRTYTVTGHELLAALETNAIDIVEYVEALVTQELTDFSGYVEHFWQKRKEYKAAGDKGRDYYCKIFLNGLYGKFAADPRNYTSYRLEPLHLLDYIIEQGLDFDYFGQWLLVGDGDKGKSRFYNLATSASITGSVRAKLWRAICAARRPLYCDTDSITAQSFDGLDLGDELGQWSIEGEYDRVVICGKKLYAFHKKGLPFDDEQKKKTKNWKKATKGAILSADQLIAIARGENVEFMPEVPTFSVHKREPVFIPRTITKTATDISTVPRRFDPLYAASFESA